MIKKIAYEDKEGLQNDENIARKNKVTDIDMNEIKETVNNNADELEQAQLNISQNTTDITNLEEEQTITTAVIKLTENIAKETEYTLPLNYIVGNNSLKIHWENSLLEEGENGNYMEIGTAGETSNKVKFGWELEAGETLMIEVRGVVNETN